MQSCTGNLSPVSVLPAVDDSLIHIISVFLCSKRDVLPKEKAVWKQRKAPKGSKHSVHFNWWQKYILLLIRFAAVQYPASCGCRIGTSYNLTSKDPNYHLNPNCYSAFDTLSEGSQNKQMFFLKKQCLCFSGFNSMVGAIMGFSILISAEVFKHHPDVWFLDGTMGVLIGLIILAYGVK